MPRSFFLACLLPLLAGGCAVAAPVPALPPLALTESHPLAGQIWDPAAHKFVTPAETAARFAAARVISLGETHDNPDHHALQAWAVQALVAQGAAPSVAFEMIDRDHQAELEAATSDLDQLGKAVGWEARGWPAWRFYQPIAAVALAAGGRLAAANLPADSTRALARGTAAPELVSRLGLDQPLPAADQEALAEEIRVSHCGLMPDAAIPGMVRVQRARDASLAEVVAALAGTGPVVLIAGSGHTRTDRGVPVRLQGLVPGLDQIAVGLIEVEAGVNDPAAYAARFQASVLPFDLVWFTGRAERDDPCIGLRQQAEQRKAR